MASKRVQIKAYIDQDIKAKFAYLAKSDNRSESNLMEFLAIKHIEEFEKKNGELIVGEDGSVTIAKPTPVHKVKSSTSKTG